MLTRLIDDSLGNHLFFQKRVRFADPILSFIIESNVEQEELSDAHSHPSCSGSMTDIEPAHKGLSESGARHDKFETQTNHILHPYQENNHATDHCLEEKIAIRPQVTLKLTDDPVESEGNRSGPIDDVRDTCSTEPHGNVELKVQGTLEFQPIFRNETEGTRNAKRKRKQSLEQGEEPLAYKKEKRCKSPRSREEMTSNKYITTQRPFIKTTKNTADIVGIASRDTGGSGALPIKESHESSTLKDKADVTVESGHMRGSKRKSNQSNQSQQIEEPLPKQSIQNTYYDDQNSQSGVDQIIKQKKQETTNTIVNQQCSSSTDQTDTMDICGRQPLSRDSGHKTEHTAIPVLVSANNKSPMKGKLSELTREKRIQRSKVFEKNRMGTHPSRELSDGCALMEERSQTDCDEKPIVNTGLHLKDQKEDTHVRQLPDTEITKGKRADVYEEINEEPAVVSTENKTPVKKKFCNLMRESRIKRSKIFHKNRFGGSSPMEDNSKTDCREINSVNTELLMNDQCKETHGLPLQKPDGSIENKVEKKAGSLQKNNCQTYCNIIRKKLIAKSKKILKTRKIRSKGKQAIQQYISSAGK